MKTFAIKTFIDKSIWVFAKTMPEIPHEYIKRTPENSIEFEHFVKFIREYGYPENFQKKLYIYFDFEGYKYWTMGATIEKTTIINRAKL